MSAFLKQCPLRVLAALWTLLAGCDSGRDESASIGAHAIGVPEQRAVLLRELKSLSHRWLDSATVDSTRVRFTLAQSVAVKGLEYHWAEYRPSDPEHGYLYALMVSRGDVSMLVRNSAEWSVLAEGWIPSNTREAARACAELYRIQMRLGLRGIVGVYGVDPVPEAVLLPGDRARMSLALRDTASALPIHDSRRVQRVRAWIVHPTERTLADEIVCELPVPIGVAGDIANLAVLRSLDRVP